MRRQGRKQQSRVATPNERHRCNLQTNRSFATTFLYATSDRLFAPSHIVVQLAVILVLYACELVAVSIKPETAAAAQMCQRKYKSRRARSRSRRAHSASGRSKCAPAALKRARPCPMSLWLRQRLRQRRRPLVNERARPLIWHGFFLSTITVAALCCDSCHLSPLQQLHLPEAADSRVREPALFVSVCSFGSGTFCALLPVRVRKSLSKQAS